MSDWDEDRNQRETRKEPEAAERAHNSLGRVVICPHCAARFEAEETYRPVREPLAYRTSQGPRPWQVALGLVLLLLAAAIALTVSALSPH